MEMVLEMNMNTNDEEPDCDEVEDIAHKKLYPLVPPSKRAVDTLNFCKGPPYGSKRAPEAPKIFL